MNAECVSVRPAAPPLPTATAEHAPTILATPLAVVPPREQALTPAPSKPHWTKRLEADPIGAGVLSWLSGVGFLVGYATPPALMFGTVAAMERIAPSGDVEPAFWFTAVAAVASMFYQGADGGAHDTAVKEGRPTPRITSVIDTAAVMVLPPAVAGLAAADTWGFGAGMLAAAVTWIASSTLGLTVLGSRSAHAEKKKALEVAVPSAATSADSAEPPVTVPHA